VRPLFNLILVLASRVSGEVGQAFLWLTIKILSFP